MSVVTKPKTPVCKILRPEVLTGGWKWHNNMAVTNGEVDDNGNLFIIYLTSGVRGTDDVMRHIRQVVKQRKSANIDKGID